MIQKIIRYAVMVMALCVFGYAAYQLTLIYLESEYSEEANDDLSNMFMQQVEAATIETETDDAGETITLNNSSNGVKFVFDYDLLLTYNSEAKGYIRQDDGDFIDNPILQHSDNDYYLTHLANNAYSSIGSIFLDYRIEEGLHAKNPIVYGHCMGKRVNQIMFGSLPFYLNYYNYANEHPVMDIYIENTHYKYYVFACYETDAVGSDTYQYSFSSDEAFLEYVAKCKEKSVKNFPQAGEIKAEDNIITLSTCTWNNKEKRTIVQLVQREIVDDSAEEQTK